MTRDPHPLHDALITPAPEPYQVDELSRRVHERDGTRVYGRALPTAATTRGHPRWRWGRRVDPPSNSGPPVIMGPSELEPVVRRGIVRGSIDEVIGRLKR